jgi:hypothetical protein
MNQNSYKALPKNGLSDDRRPNLTMTSESIIKRIEGSKSRKWVEKAVTGEVSDKSRIEKRHTEENNKIEVEKLIKEMNELSGSTKENQVRSTTLNQ